MTTFRYFRNSFLRWPRQLFVGLVAASLVATTVSPVSAQTEPADVEPLDFRDVSVDVDGHGWGHGRGMSQYGALGYALNFGWDSAEILDHYYGGTTAGNVANSLLTIRIDAARGEPTVVQVDSGSVVLFDDAQDVTHVGAGQALRLTAVDGGFVLADAPTCSGPFIDRPGVIDAETLRISTSSAQPSGGRGQVGAGQVISGDWDGDGDDEIATIDGRVWTLYDGSFANPTSNVRTTFEMPEGIALSGDWDGDGIDTAAVFADGVWALGNGEEAATLVSFGDAGDQPIAGDWDGDGNDDLGVRRGTTWFLSPETGADTIEFDYGWVSDTPLVGDWDGDGIDDAGLLRDRTWIRRPGLADGGPELARVLYANKNRFLVGDWNGDSIDQPGRHDEGVINLDGPLGRVEPRLDPFVELDESIQRCVSTSQQRYYRGELRAVHNDGDQRTVNAVAVEAYLRAVVPLEMPASWALLGDGEGASALEAQAVSARSYSLGENRTSYALTCDTISCQVYGGRAVRTNGQLTSNEHPLANEAIAATTGVVRIRDGAVARTEFSSSTGGWTAGGVFPAVEDLGDAIDRNPNHDWTVGITVGQIEDQWNGRQLDKIFVSERNGLGQDGGRVLEVTLEFEDETFTIDGNGFRRAFGLRSDWFSIDWERPNGTHPCICPQDFPQRRLPDAAAEDS